MNIFTDERKLYSLLVWLLSFLLACMISSIILFIEPSYPVVILFVQIIEVFIFAQIFIYMKRIDNALRTKTIEPIELFDIEDGKNVRTTFYGDSIRKREDT